MFDTNVTGLINMTQAILPIFLSRPEGGSGDIINIGSIAGKNYKHHRTTRQYLWLIICKGREPYPGGGIYCATKAAVRSFTESLRKELIATRIRVIGIDPGQVETVRLLCLLDSDSCLAAYSLRIPGILSRSLLRRQSQGRCRLCVSLTGRALFLNKGTDSSVLPSGCEPLTPVDIAEVIVFTATRRQNVTVADTLVYPTHQVPSIHFIYHTRTGVFSVANEA